MTEHQRQAGEVLRLAKIFSDGCGNTAPFGKAPEECPGCAADFVARVREAMTEPAPECPHQFAQVKTVVGDGGEIVSAECVCSECGALVSGIDVAAAVEYLPLLGIGYETSYVRAVGQAENPILRELTFIPEGEAAAVPRTPLPEVEWTGADELPERGES